MGQALVHQRGVEADVAAGPHAHGERRGRIEHAATHELAFAILEADGVARLGQGRGAMNGTDGLTVEPGMASEDPGQGRPTNDEASLHAVALHDSCARRIALLAPRLPLR